MTPGVEWSSSSPWFRLTLAALATWRIAHLVAKEDGPFDLVVRARAWAGDDSMFGRLMDCPYCVSIWAAAPSAWLALAPAPNGFGAWVLAWLAVSGAACLIERWFSGPDK